MSRHYARFVFLLVVADDEAALDLEAMLGQLGAGSVLLAPSLDEAEAVLSGGQIDLVIIDLGLRGAETMAAELADGGIAVLALAPAGRVPRTGLAAEAALLRMPVAGDDLPTAIDAALAAAKRGG